MGNGSSGGLGSGNGPGFGPGSGGGIAGGVFKVGGGVSRPLVISKVDPEYSEEARKAKYSGNVELSIVVDVEGRVRDVRVVKSLGMGLDEKAMEAVARWKFKPGMKGGQAVNVQALIEVNFRLL
jgi:TonB family protein